MSLEQLPPNKPNFGLILGLFCATILVAFVLAYFFVDREGGHIHFHHQTQMPVSRLVVPFQSYLDSGA